MTSNTDNALILGAGVNAAPEILNMHPRVLARMRRVVLARHNLILGQLNQLIDGLSHLSLVTDRFATQADKTRALRNQLVCIDIESLESLVLLGQIHQHMADVRAML